MLINVQRPMKLCVQPHVSNKRNSYTGDYHSEVTENQEHCNCFALLFDIWLPSKSVQPYKVAKWLTT